MRVDVGQGEVSGMRWWPIGMLVAVLLAGLMMVFPTVVRAQAGTETVTIPVSGMT